MERGEEGERGPLEREEQERNIRESREVGEQRGRTNLQRGRWRVNKETESTHRECSKRRQTDAISTRHTDAPTSHIVWHPRFLSLSPLPLPFYFMKP